ncbi:hypothetical protein [Frigoriflavimonas asaccharolytica]|uniref:Uncharacterized protein n=1 Tax=Frigoriflavimonas asaccharolytica TaxID=2735899 RepID=A0A8J8G7X7_9FLAO|nr:hypothetical protein [Frigoriflavimonas asaccharolytica]NRS91587.1 hypothetical protein [Frigoriflavimonas asaccharolytica]
MKKLLSVYQSKNFVEYLSCEFQRSKVLMSVIFIILMGYSIYLVSEKEITFYGYKVLFYQRSIAITLFVVCLMNLKVLKDLISVKFLAYPEKNLPEKIENFSVNTTDSDEIFDLQTLLLKSKSKYLGVSFSNQYDYYKIGEDLFDFKFITNKENNKESVIHDFVNFIEGNPLKFELLWIDKNPTSTKEVTYSCLLLLLKNIGIKQAADSRDKFIKNRLMNNIKFYGKIAKIGSIKSAFSKTHKNQNSD